MNIKISSSVKVKDGNPSKEITNKIIPPKERVHFKARGHFAAINLKVPRNFIPITKGRQYVGTMYAAQLFDVGDKVQCLVSGKSVKYEAGYTGCYIEVNGEIRGGGGWDETREIQKGALITNEHLIHAPLLTLDIKYKAFSIKKIEWQGGSFIYYV